jgi:hypothetical protein
MSYMSPQYVAFSRSLIVRLPATSSSAETCRLVAVFLRHAKLAIHHLEEIQAMSRIAEDC